ncbi:ABC transporter ATP-binding protein [Rhizobium sp. G21]|uniref:oligopeptide/dipeptide ABC transporter ATP-binding protein n=1 Tax=Rhizobium sp. G21 TaxID=2758439 RepID=UPI001603AE60|nr:ABC transporter ATP-binding protein [Rhizobium sp. G21]MBB1251495.1 ABC transporter ATP-binding protein [Rhizobium sp. G21]
MTAAPILETRSLSVSVPGKSRLPFVKGQLVDILRDVSLDIGRGEIISMVGESGSGKSTFGRTLVGLMNPSGGEIMLDGEALPRSRASARRLRDAAALLFQDPVTSFDPRQRIGSIIAEPRHIAGRRDTGRDAIAELAAKAGLTRNLLERFPHGLSGGQARRAAVARALSVTPRLIIADEPTAGLDLSVQAGVLNLFLDIRDDVGSAFLIITHNLAVARRVSDRVAIMYLGRIVETGPTRAIFAAPRHPYTQALLAAEPAPDPRKRRTEPPVIGETPSLLHRPTGCEFHPRCRLAQDRCRTEAPEETRLSDDHRIRCHTPLTPPASGDG